jgi:uncharacterized protein
LAQRVETRLGCYGSPTRTQIDRQRSKQPILERRSMEIARTIEVEIHNTITSELQQLASREQMTILYACESGSRAWGFPSPDSDYDVRFIYLRPLEWYLSIEDRRDTIDLPVNSLLDINGWDLRKALKLFKGSNSVIYEWLQSPIVYQDNRKLVTELLKLANNYYSGRAGIHHYLNMTTSCYREHLQLESIRLKKYFYALRPILSAKWIVTHRTFPPMVFGELLELISNRQDIVVEIDRLLTIKATANEATMIPASQILNDFIQEEIEKCELAVKLIPKCDTNSADLDRLFKQYALSSN